jgi:hypothetical protein
MTPDEHLLAELARYSNDSVCRLPIDHGTSFEPANVPEGLPDAVPHSCYHNSHTIAKAYPRAVHLLRRRGVDVGIRRNRRDLEEGFGADRARLVC